MRRFISTASLAGVLCLLLYDSLPAEVPAKINYRGWLDGYPASQVTETLIFQLFDSPTSSTPLKELAKTVDIYDGNFSVLLNFAPSDFLGSDRYIGVFKADGATELTNPRPQVVTVPYAYQAGNLYSTSDGKVGIGTNNPQDTLDVIGRVRTTQGITAGNLHVATDGRTGIGTTTPQESLDVVGRIRTTQGIDFNGTVQSTAAFGDGHSLNASDGSPVDAVYVDGAGNVGVGKTNPTEKLDVIGKVKTSAGVVYPDGGTQTKTFDGYSLDAVDGNPVDAARVDQFGNLIVSPGGGSFSGSVSAGGSLGASGGISVKSGPTPPINVFIIDRNSYGGTINNYMGPTGGVQIGLRVATYETGSKPLSVGYRYLSGPVGSQSLAYRENFYAEYNGNAWLRGTLTENSDARLKEDIEPLSGCLDKVLDLQGVTYNWRPDEAGNDREDTQIGFLGQEVHEVIPELAPIDKEGHYGVVYDRLVPVMVEAMKEQQGIIESQKSRLETLEEQLAKLQERMSRLETAR